MENECLWCEEMKSVKSARNMKKKKSSKSLASSNMKRNKGGKIWMISVILFG